MRKPVVIRTPFPTADDFAKTYGISKSRMRELEALADEITRKDSTKTEKPRLTLLKRKKKTRLRSSASKS